MKIPLGYEIDPRGPRAGRPVSIPLRHMAVLGQTQESGKTTTQEAIIMRSGLRAIAFITRRGEKAFRVCKPIPAFFREPTDDFSDYVISILEAKLEAKLSFDQRMWITMLGDAYQDNARKKENRFGWNPPKSLEDVRQNIETALPHLRGRAKMICITLRKHLTNIVPEIKKANFSRELQLNRGVNVMDISRVSTGLQALVIRSSVEWVHQKEKQTIVIIPEAWKFVPEDRTTPVKLAAIQFIREMAALKNFLWLDSQDLRGVDKELIRSVGVTLFGVQRERHEIKSTLDSLPDRPKPTATDIMQLGKGQFYVAYGTECIRTYVRPYGMTALQAEAIARGEESAESWTQIVKTLDEETEEIPEIEEIEDAPDNELGTITPDEEGNEDEDEMYRERALKAEADVLRLTQELAALRQQIVPVTDSLLPATTTAMPLSAAHRMSGKTENGMSPVSVIAQEVLGKVFQPLSEVDREDLYQWIKQRASRDPGILQMLREIPTLQIKIERPVSQIDPQSLRGQVALLISKKFFDAPKRGNAVFMELKRIGRKVTQSKVYHECDKLAELGFLTAEDSGYLAVPGMRIEVKEA